MLDRKKIPYGVQYEIARFVSKGPLKFKGVLSPNLDRIAELKTNERAAPVTYKVFEQGVNDEEGYQSKFIFSTLDYLCS